MVPVSKAMYCHRNHSTLKKITNCKRSIIRHRLYDICPNTNYQWGDGGGMQGIAVPLKISRGNGVPLKQFPIYINIRILIEHIIDEYRAYNIHHQNNCVVRINFLHIVILYTHSNRSVYLMSDILVPILQQL